jgi:glycosyltransferase involved in cell wall biosynthesis
MNPVVIIPTFIYPRRHAGGSDVVQTYDHPTAPNQAGELGRCLTSLKKVKDLGLVIILVSADPSVERQAVEKVYAEAQKHPEIATMVIGKAELALIEQRMRQLNVTNLSKEIGLQGYGAIRNLGLVVAHTLGFDAVVFLDDDEVITEENFLHKAMYGLGKLTKQGVPILAKTGYYLNDKDSYLSKWEDKWYNHFWQQGKAFNQWITQAMKGPRLSRSNHVCGGCLAIHKEAFRRLAFDPWITRGEDLDYLLNLRMYGSDIWFDNQWMLRHLPPTNKNEGTRFRQDIFRWIYEYRKLEYSRALIDLQQVKPASLEPYPGPFLESSLRWRIRVTARLRSLVRPDKKEYRTAAKAAMGAASVYAEANCSKYFEFQYVWPEAMNRLESDQLLSQALVDSGLVSAQASQAATTQVEVAADYVGAAGQPGAPKAAGQPQVAGQPGASQVAGQAATPRVHVPRPPHHSVDAGLTTEIQLNMAQD